MKSDIRRYISYGLASVLMGLGCWKTAELGIEKLYPPKYELHVIYGGKNIEMKLKESDGRILIDSHDGSIDNSVYERVRVFRYNKKENPK